MGFSIFKEEMEKEMKAMGIKALKPKVVYSKQRQTGTRISIEADRKRKALPPGKRISKNGKIYYEYRKTRSDHAGLGI